MGRATELLCLTAATRKKSVNKLLCLCVNGPEAATVRHCRWHSWFYDWDCVCQTDPRFQPQPSVQTATREMNRHKSRVALFWALCVCARLSEKLTQILAGIMRFCYTCTTLPLWMSRCIPNTKMENNVENSEFRRLFGEVFRTEAVSRSHQVCSRLLTGTK